MLRNRRRSLRDAPIPTESAKHKALVQGRGGAIAARSLKGSALFLNSLKKFNLLSSEGNNRSKYILCYSLSNGFSGCNVPLIDVNGVGPATLNSYVTGDWTIAGLLGNSSTKYTDTLWNPSLWLSAGDGHLFRWNNVNGNSTHSSIGIQDESTDGRGFYLGSEAGATSWWANIAGDNGAGQINFTHTETLVFYIVTRVNSGTTFLRRTTSQLATSTDTTPNALPNRTVFVHAKNTDGAASYFNNDRTWIMGAGAGLTYQQCNIMNGLITRLKQIIGA